MRYPALILSVLVASALAAAGAAPIIVSQGARGDFHGKDDTAIQAAIDKAIKAGGGQVLIMPGTYEITHGLRIKDAKQLALRGSGTEEVILKLPPLAFAVSAREVAAGATEIPTSKLQHLKSGTLLHIDAPGEVDAFTKKPKPYVLAVVSAVEGRMIKLKEPLKFPIPAEAMIRDERAPNLIEVRGASEGVLIEKLTLDGGATDADPVVHGHAQLCGVFAAGPYDYSKGPTGPPVKGLMIRRCSIQHCFGRGVAFYAVESGFVESCTIHDTQDEAVDIDHFSIKCAVQGNSIARCGVGVELNDASDCFVEGNEMLACATGVHLWRWCKQDDLNRRNAIYRNRFRDTVQNAIQIGRDTRDNRIEENEIDGAGRNGISLSGSSQIVVKNTIRSVKMKAIAVNEGTHKIEANATP